MRSFLRVLVSYIRTCRDPRPRTDRPTETIKANFLPATLLPVHVENIPGYVERPIPATKLPTMT
eukprot:scaffold33543_cov174-Skeletonema_dohrnii-CCMP3373.AAC.4